MSNFSKSSLISYGPEFPTGTIPDGTLFLKTLDSMGGNIGLYVYRTIRDSDSGTYGYQTTRDWFAASSSDYVLRSGDIMTGTLTLPSMLKITESSGSQRILIGNSTGSGTDKPGIINGINGIVSIGYGDSWSGTGGTMTTGLSVNASVSNGLTFLGGQVWHAGNDGSGSGLDADTLDAHDTAYFLALANATGTLAVNKGGTGRTTAGSVGQLMYTSSSGVLGFLNQSAVATNWASIANLSTGIATFPNNPWVGSTLYARPSLYYRETDSAHASILPTEFPSNSLTGFHVVAALGSPDLSNNKIGLTSVGASGYGMQLFADYTVGDSAPTGLKFRTNSAVSGVSTTWGPISTIWDNVNLTNVSQLANDAGYLTTGGLSIYVLKTGDTMTGSLQAGNGSSIGAVKMTIGDATYTGQIDFIGEDGLRKAYVGAIDEPTGTDTGTINFVSGGNYFSAGVNINSLYTRTTADILGTLDVGGATILGAGLTVTGTTAVTGAITATGDITAYSSDGRLKKNVQQITNAVEKVKSLVGYTYDWDLEKCKNVGFKPTHEHEHGLIAQNVQKVMMDAVAPAPFNEDYLTVKYERVVALLTAAICEQQEQIDDLKMLIQRLI